MNLAQASALDSEAQGLHTNGGNSLLLEEQGARDKFAFRGTLAGMGVLTFFAVYNLIQGLFIEAIWDSSSVLALLAVVVLLKKASCHCWAHRMLVFVVLYVNSYTYIYSTHSSTNVIMGFFVSPVVIFYLLGLKEGSIWAVCTTLILSAFVFLLTPLYRPLPAVEFAVETVIVFVLLNALVFAMELFRQKVFKAYLASNESLVLATQQQRRLTGLIPICSSCKRIRQDDGYWQNLESYLDAHTNAYISCGICDDCAEKDSSLRKTENFEIPEELRVLSAWKNSEEENRQIFFRFIIFIGLPILAGHVVRHLVFGLYLKAFVLMLLAVLFAVAIYYLRRVGKIKKMYYVFAAGVFLMFVNEFVTSNPPLTDMLWMYLFPFVVLFFVGVKMAQYWIILLLLFVVSLFAVPTFHQKFNYPVESLIFFTGVYSLVAFLGMLLEKLRENYSGIIRRQIGELAAAYEGIRTLKGLIPVCSVCKSIRNDEGYWTRVDYYLLKHTELHPSDAICPDCLKEQMPEIYEEMKANGEL